MTKLEAIRICERHGRGTSFLANVVLTQHANPAKKLKAIASLLESGHYVTLAPFEIDVLLIDGNVAKWSDLGTPDWRDRINELKAKA